MRAWFIGLLCLLFAPCALADGAPYLMDVYSDAGGSVAIADQIMSDSVYEVIDRMLPLPGTPWATALDAYGQIEWKQIRYDGKTGYIVGNPDVLQPKDSMDAITGFVLCQSLTLRETASGSARAVGTLAYGEWFSITDWDGDWMLAHAGERTGWVRSDYVAVDPPLFTSEGETPVYAYPDADAPRVGLLSDGESHPVIAQLEGYTVISLRGASGFIAN